VTFVIVSENLLFYESRD